MPNWDSQDTMMILTIDNLAYRYHCLPSEALERATTFDLHVLDVSTKWEQRRNDSSNGTNPSKQISIEEMQAMIARTRSEK